MPEIMGKCNFCHQVTESFVHVFWECPRILPLWREFLDWIKTCTNTWEDLSKINCLIKGFRTPLLNLLVTICKYHIFCLCFHPGDFSLCSLLSRIRNVRISDINAYRELPYLRIGRIVALWQPLRKHL